MNMNILEQEDLIKGAPDDILLQEAQSPTGSVPAFLVISEIQRRKEMRNRLSTQEQQPEQSVADQIVAEAAPQGIGALQPQMPQQMPQQMPIQDPVMAMPPPQMPPEMMAAQMPPMAPPPQMMAAGGGRMPYLRKVASSIRDTANIENIGFDGRNITGRGSVMFPINKNPFELGATARLGLGGAGITALDASYRMPKRNLSIGGSYQPANNSFVANFIKGLKNNRYLTGQVDPSNDSIGVQFGGRFNEGGLIGDDQQVATDDELQDPNTGMPIIRGGVNGGVIPSNALVEDASKFNPESLDGTNVSEIEEANPKDVGIPTVIKSEADTDINPINPMSEYYEKNQQRYNEFKKYIEDTNAADRKRQKQDMTSQALIQLGAGIAGGDISRGFRDAGASISSMREAQLARERASESELIKGRPGGSGANSSRVQSTQILENGNIATVMSDGTVIDTGESARGYAKKTMSGPEGTVVFDPQKGILITNAEGEPVVIGSAEGIRIRDALDARAVAEATEIGTSTEKQNSQFIQDAWAGISARPNLVRAIELTDLVDTGGFSRAKLAVTNLFGVTGVDKTELSNNLGKAVLSQLKKTFGAQFTEKEGRLLQNIEANMGKNAAGNKVLLQRALRLVDRAINRGIKTAIRRGDDQLAADLEEERNFMLVPEETEDNEETDEEKLKKMGF